MNRIDHQVQLRVYANNDAYIAGRWDIFNYISPIYTMDGIYLAVDGTYSRNDSTTAEAYSWPP